MLRAVLAGFMQMTGGFKHTLVKNLRKVKMFMESEKIKKMCEENHIRMIDFKMTDIDGRWRHITIPVERFGESTFTQGIGFDGSNYGFAPVEKSDMVFLPDPDTAYC